MLQLAFEDPAQARYVRADAPTRRAVADGSARGGVAVSDPRADQSTHAVSVPRTLPGHAAAGRQRWNNVMILRLRWRGREPEAGRAPGAVADASARMAAD